ncbi:MAG: tyrosine recombinase XerC [Candidatus Thioglobus sp.]|nr:MAG: tyrosine recombinase XerC [Candidatus Thioglobus sp.]
MQKNIDNFISYLEIERNYALNTRRAYNRDLQQLLRFLQQQNINSLSTVSPEQLKTTIMNLRSRGSNARSISRYLSAVRGFFAYLFNHNAISNNPALGLKAPKIEQNLPKIISYEQIALLLKPRAQTPSELRDVAILEVIYACGLRVSELTSLDINSIDKQQGFLQIVGKGGKMRHTPIGKFAQQAISNYLQKIGSNQGALFLNQKGNRISTRAIELMIKKRALEIGIKISVYPHMLRHAAATHFLQSSHDLRSVQEFLGHKSIKSTQTYTHLDFLELSKVYDQCHPRAKKLR